MDEVVKIPVKALKEFVSAVLIKHDISRENSVIVAEVLVTADQRGVSSHGVQRLIQYYTSRIKNGVIIPNSRMEIIKETPCTLHVSGGDGLGQVTSVKTMRRVIEKAKENHLCVASVFHSNHYGIAGYYSMMALEHDLIGISLTNSSALVVPTFGRNALLGTNPISVAAPARTEWPFVLDMATATAPLGKIELYKREKKPIPLYWGTDNEGIPSSDPEIVIDSAISRKGGLLPIGGADEESAGHKGYGLGFLVDILTGVLAGGAFSINVWKDKTKPANVCHFFAAIDPKAFIGLDEFKDRMDEYIRMLKDSSKARGKERIYVHGEKEYELFSAQKEKVTIMKQVVDEFRDMGRELGIDVPF